MIRTSHGHKDLEILSASREERLVKLYERFALDLARARKAIEKIHDLKRADTLDMAAYSKAVERKAENLSHAGEIVLYLIETLDREQAPGIVESLTNYYAHFQRELTAVHADNDLERLTRLTDVVTQMRDAWREAAEIVQKAGGLDAVTPPQE